MTRQQGGGQLPAPVVAVEALDDVVAACGGEERSGQQDMAAWVAQAIEDEHHLIVEAGTGVGKSFGYLVPAMASGRRVVVATSTKTLQDQIAGDLPRVAKALRSSGLDADWAVVKGRGSYLCPAKLAEVRPGLGLQGTLLDSADDPVGVFVAWWRGGGDGEREHAPAAIDDATWASLSVSGMECPGASCSFANECPAMDALRRARDAQLVVCNHHLYGTTIQSDDVLLGEHDAVVFDEAHRLEDSLCSALGIALTPGRLAVYANSATAMLNAFGVEPTARKQYMSTLWSRIKPMDDWIRRLSPGEIQLPIEGDVAASIRALDAAVSEVHRVVRDLTPKSRAAAGLRDRTANLSGHLRGDLSVLIGSGEGYVCWVDPGPVLRGSPVSVAGLVAENLAARRTCILTSATLTVSASFGPLAARLGFATEVADMTQVESDDTDSGRYMTLRVASPFDYERQARIFLPDLPDPRDESWGKQVADLTGELVRAAGGRTLVLCTSNVAVSRISAALASADVRILTQGDQPRGALLDGFRADPTSVLVATMGFWEGVDIVGDACQMVVIDRIPFPRPDDPLWRARRSEAEAAGLSAFNSVDLPRAASLTAQGAGRLIRSMDDLGMIVICDRRIRSKGYGKRILQTLPEMPVITDHADALSYLESLSNA